MLGAISTTGRGEFLEAIIDDDIELPAKLPRHPFKEGTFEEEIKA
jgi:hypothetical protein